MKRLETTRHTVRCPVEDESATVTVRSDPGAAPSRRHLDVRACSLQPWNSFVPPARSGYFGDVAPPVSYLAAVDPTPQHPPRFGCRKRCLALLNAAEAGTAQPIPCTSGVNDSLELARQTQSPAITRLLWFYGV